MKAVEDPTSNERSNAKPGVPQHSAMRIHVIALVISGITTFCWQKILLLAPIELQAIVFVAAMGAIILGLNYRTLMEKYAKTSIAFWDFGFERIQAAIRTPGSRRYGYFFPLALLLRTSLYCGIGLTATMIVLIASR